MHYSIFHMVSLCFCHAHFSSCCRPVVRAFNGFAATTAQTAFIIFAAWRVIAAK